MANKEDVKYVMRIDQVCTPKLMPATTKLIGNLFEEFNIDTFIAGLKPDGELSVYAGKGREPLTYETFKKFGDKFDVILEDYEFEFLDIRLVDKNILDHPHTEIDTRSN